VIFERYFASLRIRQCKVGHHSNPEIRFEPVIDYQSLQEKSVFIVVFKKKKRKMKSRGTLMLAGSLKSEDFPLVLRYFKRSLEEKSFIAWYKPSPLDSATKVETSIVFWLAFPFLRTFWPVGFIAGLPC